MLLAFMGALLGGRGSPGVAERQRFQYVALGKRNYPKLLNNKNLSVNGTLSFPSYPKEVKSILLNNVVSAPNAPNICVVCIAFQQNK